MIDSLIESLGLFTKTILENVLKGEVPFYFLKFEQLISAPEA